jgi:hypothetical protein
VEHSGSFSKKIKCAITSWSANPLLYVYTKELKSGPQRMRALMFLAVLFTIARRWMGSYWATCGSNISNEVWFGLLKEGNPDTWHDMNEVRGLSELSQSQKDKSCVSPFMLRTCRSNIHRGRTQNGGYQGWGRKGQKLFNVDSFSLFMWQFWRWHSKHMSVLNYTELYTWKWLKW